MRRESERGFVVFLDCRCQTGCAACMCVRDVLSWIFCGRGLTILLGRGGGDECGVEDGY